MLSRFPLPVIVLVSALAAGSAQAQATATRTWVSGVGDDVNPCSRTAPCKTFAGALAKTAAGGEISVLDGGGFGAVTITRSVTINGDGALAGIAAAGSNGVVVNAQAGDIVVLRGLAIQGAGSGLSGIRVLGAGRVLIERCSVGGFTGSGVEFSSADGQGSVAVAETSISGCATGIKVAGGTGCRLLVDRTRILDCGHGVRVQAQGSATTIVGSVLSGCSLAAAFAEAGTINLEGSVLADSGVGVKVGPGGLVRLADNGIYGNQAGFEVAPRGGIESDGDNRLGGNGGKAPVFRKLALD